jgi:hypothetical protein
MTVQINAFSNIIFQHPLALVNYLIFVGGLQDASPSRVRGLLLCCLVTFFYNVTCKTCTLEVIIKYILLRDYCTVLGTMLQAGRSRV